MSATFLALYRGDSIGSAKLLTLTADPGLVEHFADQMLSNAEQEKDPVLGEIEHGRQRALQLVRDGDEE